MKNIIIDAVLISFFLIPLMWLDKQIINSLNRRPALLKTYTLVFDEPETVYKAIYGENWETIMKLDKEWENKLLEVK